MAGPWERYREPVTIDGATGREGPWSQYGGQSASPVDKIPGMGPERAPSPGVPMLERIRPAELVDTGLSVARNAVAGPVGAAARLLGGEQAGEKVGAAVAGEPFTRGGKENISALARMIADSKLGGMNPTGAMGPRAMPPIAGDLAAGAKAAPPHIMKLAEQIAGPTLRPAFAGAAEAVGPTGPTRTLAQTAQEKYGIPLRPDMLSEKKLPRLIGETLEQVPLSGDQSGARQIAFNKALMKTMGVEDVERLTPDVYERGLNRAGKQIGDLSAKYPVPYSGPLASKLGEHVAQAGAYETSDVAKVVNAYVSEIANKADGGVIDGTALRKIRTKLTGQMRRTQNGDLKHALSELDDDILEAIQTQLKPDELEAFNGARQQYSAAKTIESLVATSKNGDISPQALMQKMTANASGKSAMARGKGGDMGELARIGQRFLKEPASSGTAERLGAYGLLGGAGSINPLAAGALWAGANLYNRAGPAISRRITKPGEIPPPP